MKTVVTKLPKGDYERFREACGKRGMTLYECLKYLIYRFLEESGYQVDNPPLEVRLAELERHLAELRSMVTTLANRVSELEAAVKKQQGPMDRFMKRR